jgi:hypothetical protein
VTPAEHDLIVAVAALSAERWAAGATESADRIAGIAFDLLGRRDFVDLDAEADR